MFETEFNDVVIEVLLYNSVSCFNLCLMVEMAGSTATDVKGAFTL